MCFNKETSLITFIIGFSFSIFNIWYFDELIIKLLSFLWLWVIMMQFFEFMAWDSQPKKTPYGDYLQSEPSKKNTKAANLALIFNLTQPIILALGLICFVDVPLQNKVLAMTITFIYICWIIYALNNSENFNKLTPTEECSHINLYWWQDQSGLPGSALFYIIALFSTILLLVRPFDLALFEAFLIGTMLLISMFVYKCNYSTASIWCWLAAFGSLFTAIYWIKRKSIK